MSTPVRRPLRVAALPFALPPAGVAAELSRAASDGVSLAVFPELSLVGILRIDRLRRAELDALSEPLFGTSIDAVAQAVEMSGVAAGVGWIERGDDGALYNSYVVCMPGGVRHRHRKVYVTENPHLRTGERFDVHDTPWGATMTILIGADNYLPENARVAALKGATLLVAPHRSHSSSAQDLFIQREWCVRTLPARAGDNGMFAVLSDVAQVPKTTSSSGAAVIAGPSGAVLAAGDTRHASIAIADIDPGTAQSSIARRWLNARRPELYSALISSEAQDGEAARAGTPTWTAATREAHARGSVAVSFAVVGRKRSML
ncbi:MAG TPA: nitrilase-related carbon-nitrogen hydrolase [Trinickia sp.]|nr:nitrilase-related carbon-nitrogen hydrolase [Trinickia sp.]